jgi:acyl carrier protein
MNMTTEKECVEVAWLRHWFQARGAVVGEQLTVNYFDAGLIDSLAVVELIEAMEEEYSIRFNEKNFTDKRFTTIVGLAGIIQELRQA